MPCFAALASAFRGSHSNTYLVYTKCVDPMGEQAKGLERHGRRRSVRHGGRNVARLAGLYTEMLLRVGGRRRRTILSHASRMPTEGTVSASNPREATWQ